MKWQSHDCLDPRVIDHAWDTVPNFPGCLGVYIFADTDLQVKYVGMTTVNLRAEAMNANQRSKGRGATRAQWLETTAEDALELEQDLIKKYNPPNNGREVKPLTVRDMLGY